MLLLGGGSGVVPLMAMPRPRRRTMPELPMRRLYSVGNADDVIYADELSKDATSPSRATRQVIGAATAGTIASATAWMT